MPQHKFTKGDLVKLKYGNPDSPAWIVDGISSKQINGKSVPLIMIKQGDRSHGVLENEIILESGCQEDC